MNMPHPDKIGDIPLHRKAPFAVVGISTSQMSPCRHYGCMRYQGHDYVYDPTNDTMWRWDVVNWFRAQQRRVKAIQAAETIQQTPNLL